MVTRAALLLAAGGLALTAWTACTGGHLPLRLAALTILACAAACTVLTALWAAVDLTAPAGACRWAVRAVLAVAVISAGLAAATATTAPGVARTAGVITVLCALGLGTVRAVRVWQSPHRTPPAPDGPDLDTIPLPAREESPHV